MKKIIFVCFWSVWGVCAALSQVISVEQSGSVREKKANPQIALSEASSNLKEAILKKNNPLIVKYLLEYASYQTEISRDSFPSIIRYTDRLLRSSADSVQRAVLSSVEAQMLLDYSGDIRYVPANDIPVNETPDLAKIDEWDKEAYVRKISGLLQESLKPAELLQQTPVQMYDSALVTGQDSRVLRPTMFDFLAYRAIDIYKSLLFTPVMPLIMNESPLTGLNLTATDFIVYPYFPEKYQIKHQILAVYQMLLRFRASEPHSPAYLMADLGRLKFLQENTPGAEYPRNLKNLLNVYKSSPYSVEIAVDLLDYYSRIWNTPTETKAYLVKLSDELISRFPDYARLGCLKDNRNSLTAYSLNLSINKVLYPDVAHTVSFEYKNIKKLFFKLYRIESKDSILQLTDTLTLCDTLTLADRNGKWSLPALKNGSYVVNVSSGKSEDSRRIAFVVSRIYALSGSLSGENSLVILTDSKTGKPLSGIPVKMFGTDKESSYLGTVKSDRMGLVSFNKQDTVRYFKPEMKSDVYYPMQELVYGYSYGENRAQRKSVSLFTDRSVYRPGQVVHFSGIDYQIGEKGGAVIPDGNYTVVLSASGKEVARQVVHGDSYGSFTGSFVLPADILPGYYTINIDGGRGSAFIQVSEYKKPAFRILFETVKESVSLGTPVSVMGKAVSFSGVPVSDAEVSYTVQRYENSWRRYRGGEQVAQGKLLTGEDGGFTIRFIAEKKVEDALKTGTSYRFKVEVNVTSANGETQSQSYWITVGESPLSVQMQVPGMIDKDAPSPVKFDISNRMGEPVSVNCKYILYSLYDTKEPLSDRNITAVDSLKIKMQVEEKTFRSNTVPDMNGWKSLQSGRYRLVLQVTDPNGQQIIRNTDFVLYGKKDKKPPVNVYEWLPKDRYKVSSGEYADIVYGTSVKSAYVLYTLYDGARLLESRRIKISDKNYHFRILYKPEYGDRLELVLTFIQNGQFYSSTVNIDRKKPDMNLSVVTSSFRDKTIPGSSESWSFTVKDASGNPVSARFMAEMFDASLNEIFPHNWNFRPEYNPVSYNFWLRSLYQQNIWMAEQLKDYCVPFSFDYFRNEEMWVRGVDIVDFKEFSTAAPRSMLAAKQSNSKADSVNPEEGEGNGVQREQPVAQYRKNFDETAFFYPLLTTNQQGEVTVKFTVPESNTEWQFQALTYTKDLKFGSYENKMISQKQLMVAPNVPRFVRQGDEVSVAVLIQNISNRLMNGDFSFELYDPYTDKILMQKKQEFILEAGKSKSEEVGFSVPEGLDVIGIRVSAAAPGVSDGEQHILPVLPSRTLVTESESFVLRGGKETETVTMKGLSKTSGSEENYRMVLEYTANPLWYVVQALPQLNEVSGTDVVGIAAALYGNTVASVLARNNPKIISALQTWKAKNVTGSALRSALEKNESLKSVLISETPWALEAQNETERLQSLSQLLDISRSEQLQNKALNLLRELQQPEGGWSWIKKMPVSFPVTINTLGVLTCLTKLGGIQYDEPSKYMQMRAIGYLDSCIVLDQEKQKNGFLSAYNKLLYAYIRSSFRDIPLARALDAHKEIMADIKKNWVSFSLYEKALASVTLYRYGFIDEAKDILQSLRGYSTTTKNLGMFWQNNKSSYFYRNSAIQIHTAIMDAFAEIDPAAKQELNEMKRWLVMQKQTQNWGSVPSTVDAIGAILNTGDYMLSGSGNPVKITWGKEVLKPETTDGFTGYEQYIRQGSEITPGLANVTISTDQEQPSWGALYRQYFADFTDIKNKSVSGLSIEKQLFVEQSSEKGKVYEPLNKVTLKSGDKVNVRMVIKTDRDLDFVHVKDQRPACFEPIDQLSRYECKDGVCYYQETKDAVTNLYFDFLPKGTSVVSYDVWVDRPGSYHNGISTIQCLYAPQWVANTQGSLIIVR